MYRQLARTIIAYFALGVCSALAQGASSVDDLTSSIGLNAPAIADRSTEAVGDFTDTGRTRSALVSRASQIAPSQPFRVMLRLIPDEGWHTYWRNPGDSGLPTTIEWDLPPGFEASAIDWPAPQAVPYGPLTNFGYKDEARLLVTITPPDGLPAGEDVTIQARADWLVCADICIPEGADHSLTLGTGATPLIEDQAAPLFEAAEAAVPTRTMSADYGVRERTLWLEIDATPFGAGAGSARFFPYEENLIENRYLMIGAFRRAT